MKVHYTNNPDLPLLKLPFEWHGTPVNEKGAFVNHEFPYIESFGALLKWQTMVNPQKVEKKNDHWRLEVAEKQNFLTSESDCVVWLGHAAFFIRLAGVSMLIDPVLFDMPFFRRQAALPVDPQSFDKIDYILISHDHRDHCDEKSLKLLARNNPEVIYLSGLGMGSILRKITGSGFVQTAGWYQQYVTAQDISITFVPSRHWGLRGINDMNVRLWGGFVIKGSGKTIYFGGDSGYGSHFADIGKAFPDIDYGLLGIGAYKPEFFMAQSHTSPEDAFKAFQDCKAKVMIPMHYGTFDLSDEPPGDPVRALQSISEQNDAENKVKFLRPGEILSLS